MMINDDDDDDDDDDDTVTALSHSAFGVNRAMGKKGEKRSLPPSQPSIAAAFASAAPPPKRAAKPKATPKGKAATTVISPQLRDAAKAGQAPHKPLTPAKRKELAGEASELGASNRPATLASCSALAESKVEADLHAANNKKYDPDGWLEPGFNPMDQPLSSATEETEKTDETKTGAVNVKDAETGTGKGSPESTDVHTALEVKKDEEVAAKVKDAETETGKDAPESTDVKTALEVKKDEEVAASATSPTMTSIPTAETATEAVNVKDAEIETGNSPESTAVNTALEVKKDEEVAASATSPTMTSSRTAETATEATKVNDAETETAGKGSQESTDVKTALKVKKDGEVAASATSPTMTSIPTAETATEALNVKDAEIETGNSPESTAVNTALEVKKDEEVAASATSPTMTSSRTVETATEAAKVNDAETETGKGSQESTDVKTALKVKKDEEVAASATSPTMTSSRTAETATEAAKVNDAETETGKGSQESTDVKTALEVKKDEEVAASATSPTTTSSRTAETATEAVNMKDAEIETRKVRKGSPVDSPESTAVNTRGRRMKKFPRR